MGDIPAHSNGPIANPSTNVPGKDLPEKERQSGVSVETGAKACNRMLDEVRDSNSDKPLVKSRSGNVLVSNLETGQSREESTEDYIDWEKRPGLYGIQPEDVPLGNGEMLKPSPYRDAMKRVFGNSTFELVRNHNQVLDVDTKKAMKRAAVNEEDPVTLINFDAHSDLYKHDADDEGESIAEWVNKAIKDNPNIKDVYWALPNDFKDNEQDRMYFFERNGKSPTFSDNALDSKIYVNKETGKMHWNEQPKDYSEDTYRTINFHKRAFRELPDMKGKNVILSTDLDGFDNRGYDTDFGASVKWKGEKGFSDYVETLEKKNIKPFLHMVSVSPEYLREEHLPELLRFAAEAGEASLDKMDQIATNKRNYMHDIGAEFPHSGVTTEREGNPSLQLLYRMFAQDKLSTKQDGVLDISKQNEELSKVMKDTKRLFGTDENGAKKILQNLDGKDGMKDGVIEFEAIEALLAKVCQAGTPAIKVKKSYH